MSESENQPQGRVTRFRLQSVSEAERVEYFKNNIEIRKKQLSKNKNITNNLENESLDNQINISQKTNVMPLGRSPPPTRSSIENINMEDSGQHQESTMQQQISSEWQRLKKMQAEIDQQFAKLEEERVDVARQRQQLEDEREEFRIHVNDLSRRENHAAVNKSVSNLHNLNIEMKTPKFNNDKNPREFIEELESYFKIKSVRREQQMLVIESIIEDRVKLWYEIEKTNIDDFESFKSVFENEFYSIPVRVRFKNKWLSRRYMKSADGSMHSYFYKQIKDARYFEPQLTAYEINYSIAQQFPYEIRKTLATVNFSDTNVIAQALSQLDVAREETNAEKQKQNWRSGNVIGLDDFPQKVNNLSVDRDYPRNRSRRYNGRRYDLNQINDPQERYKHGKLDYRERHENINAWQMPNTSVPPPNVSGSNNERNVHTSTTGPLN